MTDRLILIVRRDIKDIYVEFCQPAMHGLENFHVNTK